MGYECIVCYERCKVPVSCTRCLKLICKSHVFRLEDRCPNCRLEPYTFKEEKFIGQLISLEIYVEREEMKKNKVFKCLVQGCKFEGKFHPIALHRRKTHYTEKLEQTIFPEERENKIKRQTLKNLLAARLSRPPNKNLQLAFFLYGKAEGKCSLPALAKMIQHIDACTGPCCKRVVISSNSAFIGDNDRNQTSCPLGLPLISYF